jgi:hypothetical protein
MADEQDGDWQRIKSRDRVRLSLKTVLEKISGRIQTASSQISSSALSYREALLTLNCHTRTFHRGGDAVDLILYSPETREKFLLDRVDDPSHTGRNPLLPEQNQRQS